MMVTATRELLQQRRQLLLKRKELLQKRSAELAEQRLGGLAGTGAPAPIPPVQVPVSAEGTPRLAISSPLVTERIGPDPFRAAGGIAGGIAGTAIGLPAAVPSGGTVPLATGALGGLAGTGIGQQVFEAARATENFVMGSKLPPRTTEQRITGQVEALTEEAGMQALFQAGARIGSPLVRGLGKLGGLRKGALRGARPDPPGAMARRAALQGVDFGAIDTNKPLFNGIAAVTGTMPIAGGPLRTGRFRKFAQLSNRFTNLLNDISPPVDALGLSPKLTQAAVKTLGRVRRNVAHNYGEMFRYFDEIGDPRAIPTRGMKANVLDSIRGIKGLPRGASGQEVGFKPILEETFEQQLENILDLGEFIRPSELRQLQRSLNKTLKTVQGPNKSVELGVLQSFGQSIRDAFANVDTRLVSGEQAAEIARRVSTANKSFGAMKDMIDTAAASNLAKVDANLLKAQFAKPGSLNLDELAESLASSKSTLRSPIFIQDLESLIGVENRKKVARLAIEKASGFATDEIVPELAEQVARDAERLGVPVEPGLFDGRIKVFNAAGMRDALGLTDTAKSKGNVESLQRLFRGTNISATELGEFLEVADGIQKAKVNDPSAFLTRRVTLSGGLSVPGTQTLRETGLGQAGEFISLGGFLFSATALSKLISSPDGLRVLRTGMRVNPTRRQAVLFADRLRRVLPEGELEVTLGDLPEPSPRAQPRQPAFRGRLPQ